jgi:outer membrane protein assembly factor BamE (lipoprotein component of BamABCDE complex)
MMSTRTRLLLLSLVLIVAVTIVGFGFLLLRCPHCHGAEDRFLFALFLRDDATQYAPGFSDSGFDQVTKGMSEKDVILLVGDPIKKEIYQGQSFDQLWRYTKAPPGRNFWFRIVLFKEGKVLGTEAKYFAD